MRNLTTTNIVSSNSESIQNAIISVMGRGVTVLKGTSGYGKKGRQEKSIDVIYTVITRLEIQKMRSEIAKIDEDVFVVESRVNDIQGGMIKRRAM